MTGAGEIDHLATLAALQRAFLEATGRADPTTPVPWCGRWRVRELVVHLARIHHWAAAQARRRQERPLGRGPFDLPRLYADCAAELLTTLTELDPDARAWTLLDDGVPRERQRGTVGFWHRRQVHETLVHLWDLTTAIGEPWDADPALWVDCLDEAVGVMHPRQVRLGRVEEPARPVELVPDETRAPLRVIAADAGDAVAVIRGPARALALLVWGRTDLDVAEIRLDGDRAEVDRLLVAGLTP